MQVKTYPSIKSDLRPQPTEINESLHSQNKKFLHFHRRFFVGLSLTVALLVSGFLWIAVGSFSKNTDNRNKAAIDPVTTIQFTPAAVTVSVGQEFIVPIELVTGTRSIAVAEILPSFDASYFRAMSLTSSTFLTQTLTPATVGDGVIVTPLLVAKPIAIPPTAMSGQGPIAVLKLKALKAGTSNVAFDQSKTRAPEFMGPSENVVGAYHPLTVTIQDPSSTTPTPLPSPTPVPSPSANPTAIPAPATSFLRLEFKLQGLRKAGVEIPTNVTIKYTEDGLPTIIREFTKTYATASSSGVLASDTPLPLDGVFLNGPASAEIYVKAPTSLQKKLGSVTLQRGTTELVTTTELFVGDFNQDPGQKNIFNILDIAKMLNHYTSLNNPLTDENRAFDVNFDGTFTILDTSLVISNYQSLQLEGQHP
ncbi:hypothetical protein KA012_00435 [Candidatus Woesebacteria bacterium]|nr:hypothetical protein [Candidatus Woesebacteria bacterium]